MEIAVVVKHPMGHLGDLFGADTTPSGNSDLLRLRDQIRCKESRQAADRVYPARKDMTGSRPKNMVGLSISSFISFEILVDVKICPLLQVRPLIRALSADQRKKFFFLTGFKQGKL